MAHTREASGCSQIGIQIESKVQGLEKVAILVSDRKFINNIEGYVNHRDLTVELVSLRGI